jgi:hypothetical protein
VPPTRHNPLRKIAEAELDRRFADLDSQLKQELATSLARQWLTNEGHAGLVTTSGHYWFKINRTQNGGFEVGFDAQPPRFVDNLRRANVAEDQLSGLLHQLSLCQSVVFPTQDGRILCLRMIAKERTLLIEPAANENDQMAFSSTALL